MARRRRGGRAATADQAESKGRQMEDNGGRETTKKRRGLAGGGGGGGSSCSGHFVRRWWAVLAATLIIPALAVRFFGVSPFLELKRSNVQEEGTASDQGKARSEPPSPNDLESIYVGDKYEVLQTIPHDPAAFTQGLTYHNGRLYEGTGLNGQSQLRELSPTDGSLVVKSHSMHGKYFGEGITHFHDGDGNGRIIQLTWKELTGFVYDAETFEVVREFAYETSTGEGWGITYDAAAAEFIVSDGSHWLSFWDRDTLQEKRRVEVRLPQRVQGQDSEGQIQMRPVKHINELELVHGHILANVWYQDVLLGIDPRTGNVVKVYDFSKLYTDRAKSADCFNGISVSDREGELFVTGKWWPNMYRIKLLG